MALPSENGPQYQIQELNARHHAILQYLALGLKNVDIAEKLGISAQSVSIVRNSQLGRAKLGELVGRTEDNVVDIKKRLEGLAPLATDTLEDLLTDPKVPSATKATIARDILDRGGHSAIRRAEFFGALLSGDDIKGLRDSLQERYQYGPVMDVEPEEVVA
jgi:hypothetical protein